MKIDQSSQNVLGGWDSWQLDVSLWCLEWCLHCYWDLGLVLFLLTDRSL